MENSINQNSETSNSDCEISVFDDAVLLAPPLAKLIAYDNLTLPEGDDPDLREHTLHSVADTATASAKVLNSLERYSESERPHLLQVALRDVEDAISLLECELKELRGRRGQILETLKGMGAEVDTITPISSRVTKVTRLACRDGEIVHETVWEE